MSKRLIQRTVISLNYLGLKMDSVKKMSKRNLPSFPFFKWGEHLSKGWTVVVKSTDNKSPPLTKGG